MGGGWWTHSTAAACCCVFKIIENRSMMQSFKNNGAGYFPFTHFLNLVLIEKALRARYIL